MKNSETRYLTTIQHSGLKAKIRVSNDGNLHLYVKWYNADGTEILEWDKANRFLNQLLQKVILWNADKMQYTLWSY